MDGWYVTTQFQFSFSLFTMRRSSFTLIEMIVVIGVIALLVPTIFAMTFAMVRQQLLLYGYSEIKRQGALVQQSLRNTIANRATAVTDASYADLDICPPLTTPSPTPASRIYLLDSNNDGFSFFQELGEPYRFASYSATTGKTYYLTNSMISISDVSFTCYRTHEASAPFVYASYTSSKTVLDRTISLPFKVRVQLGSGFSY